MQGLEDQSKVFRFYLKCNRKSLKKCKAKQQNRISLLKGHSDCCGSQMNRTKSRILSPVRKLL